MPMANLSAKDCMHRIKYMEQPLNTLCQLLRPSCSSPEGINLVWKMAPNHMENNPIYSGTSSSGSRRTCALPCHLAVLSESFALIQ